jgi:uncharacterized protein
MSIGPSDFGGLSCARRPFKVKFSVARLFGPEFVGIGIDQQLSFAGDLGARYPAGVRMKAHVSKIAHGVHVEGAVAGREHETCARCLEPFERDVRVEVEETYSEDVPESDAIFGDVAPLIGRAIDLTELATQILEVDEPIAPVCDEACNGLCDSCGQNRNIGSCTCAEHVVDPRLAGLARSLQERRES